MVRNKLAHTVAGLATCALGVVAYRGAWLSPHLSPVFLVVAVAGAWWAASIGHAGMVLPLLVVGPPYWLFERLDPRRAAATRRRARRGGLSAVSMVDVAHYGTQLGHEFRYCIDGDGALRVSDLGERDGWTGRHDKNPFGGGRSEALVCDFDDDTPDWQWLSAQPWMLEGPRDRRVGAVP